MNETEKLSQFITDTNYSDLNDEIIEKVKRLILDQLGCQLAFAGFPWNKTIYRYISDKVSSKKESTVTFYGLKTSAEDAAFANAIFGHGFEMDDTELTTASHPGVTVIPPTLAISESQRMSGKEFITAVVIGYDVFIRAGLATHSMMKRGFHTTSVLGPLGAAAAVCKLLKFDTSQTVSALAIASSCSGGLAEYAETGGTAKRVHAGFAAANGLKAALLAKNGITGPHTALEGKKGFCQAFADNYSVDELTKDLGKKFRIMLTGNKPYCCCAAQHAAIDAVSEMIETYLIVPESIDKILVRQKERDVKVVGNIVEPHDIVSAQFSGRFGIALRLVKGGNGFRDYSEENLSDSRIKDLLHRINYETDEGLKNANPSGAPASVQIRSKDGNVYERTVQFAKGTIQNPMTCDELKNKFRELAETVLSRKKVEEIIRSVGKLEKIEDLSTLTSLLVPD